MFTFRVYPCWHAKSEVGKLDKCLKVYNYIEVAHNGIKVFCVGIGTM